MAIATQIIITAITVINSNKVSPDECFLIIASLHFLKTLFPDSLKLKNRIITRELSPRESGLLLFRQPGHPKIPGIRGFPPSDYSEFGFIDFLIIDLAR
jgi:hypothetical protein